MNGRVALLNDDLDIALVQVPRLGPSDATLTLGDSSRLRLGQGVVALGSGPEPLAEQLTRGVVSGPAAARPADARPDRRGYRTRATAAARCSIGTAAWSA